MNSKSIGNIGEAKVLAKFVENNIPIYIPFGDNEQADFIVEVNNKLLKIQVKTAQFSSNGKISFDIANYKYDNIDIFACYSIELDEIYLIDAKKAPKTTINIRYENTANGQDKFVRKKEDYLFENILGSLAQ